MGLVLFVLAEKFFLWFPSLLAAYAVVKGGPGRRRLALLLWPVAVLLAFLVPLGPTAGWRETAVTLFVASVLGGLLGEWQRRVS